MGLKRGDRADDLSETRKRIQDGTGANPYVRTLIFYSVSLLLSFLIIVVSTTTTAVVAYLQPQVSAGFFYLFVGIIAANVPIAAISLRAIFRIYPKFSGYSMDRRALTVERVVTGSNPDGRGQASLHVRGKLTEAELIIVDLLERNGRRMLQSRIFDSSGMSRASVSRAITSLENRGVIMKMRKGVTNEIILSEIDT